MNDQQQTATMQYIGGLFFRRLHETLSEPEQAELDAWLNRQQPDDRRFFEEMTDWEQIQSALQYMYGIDVPAALAEVQKKILLETVNGEPVPASGGSPTKGRLTVADRATHRTRRTILSYKYAAAAAVVGLVIGGAALFTLLKKKDDLSTKPIAERFRNDVAPASEKAILELADGSRIALDSAAKGELVQQGSTRVLKQDNGQLKYDAEKTTPGATGIPYAYNTVTTPRGGQYRVVLPDGSKVWLNAASSLRFPTGFAGHERKVELVGEAYFEVAKNPAMPFKVTVKPFAGNAASAPMEVEVLGTEFNINAYGDETDRRTTLLQGSVKITAGSGQSLLKPGQQARVNAGGLQIMPEVDTDEVIAWKNGLFQFKEANIQSIMRQVSRWYDVEVEYRGNIHQQFFGKIPRRVQVSTLLKILESTGWVHFAIEGKKITVAP